MHLGYDQPYETVRAAVIFQNQEEDGTRINGLLGSNPFNAFYGHVRTYFIERREGHAKKKIR